MTKERSKTGDIEEISQKFDLMAKNPDKSETFVTNYKYSKLNPKKLFELVSNNYESWQQAMNKQFIDEDNYLPFPQEDQDHDYGDDEDNDKPIFDYSLLDQLENQELDKEDESDTFACVQKLNEIMNQNSPTKIESDDQQVKQSENDNKDHKLASLVEALSNLNKLDLFKTAIEQKQNGSIPANELLNENDMDVLRYKIANMINYNHNGSMDELEDEDQFDIDIDIIHDQDNYDVNEIIEDSNYSYSHHIDVELNQNKPQYEEGPSCEFTFEYDKNGKLIPTYNNVEEKIQLLQNKTKLPSINELNLKELPDKKDKRKKNKKKLENNVSPPIQGGLIMNSNCCLICEYEIVFGHKPKQLIKLYNQRVERDEKRRLEIKKKLENAKLKAMKKQRELRQRQQQQLKQIQNQNEHSSESTPDSGNQKQKPQESAPDSGNQNEKQHQHSKPGLGNQKQHPQLNSHSGNQNLITQDSVSEEPFLQTSPSIPKIASNI
jgi:hypothetical protein